MDRPVAAILLAAGKGTRMGGDLPKVALPVAGRPMICWVVDAVREAGADPIVLVVGHGAEHVRSALDGDARGVRFVHQDEQLGTGHATSCARAELASFDGDVLVLAGDGPLIRPGTIRAMLRRQRETGAAATLATAVLDDPAGYGRIVRAPDGSFRAIVEHRNATAAQREIHEIYPSYACFDARLLFAALAELPPDGVTGEYYVTDVPSRLRAQGHRVEVIEAVPAEDVLSINTPEQLTQVEAILTARLDVAAAEGRT